MNRPKMEDYYINISDYEGTYGGQYSMLMEKYCDELEEEQEKMKEALTDIVNPFYDDVKRLEKALDKACKQLEIDIHIITTTGRVWSCEEWKEWCLKDE